MKDLFRNLPSYAWHLYSGIFILLKLNAHVSRSLWRQRQLIRTSLAFFNSIVLPPPNVRTQV